MGSSLFPLETDIAWVAGIIDGEGTIGLWNYRTRSSGAQLKRPYLAVAMTCQPTMERVRDILGPGLKLYSPKLAKAHYKEQWRFAVSNRKVEKICRMIEPYSITKRDAILKVFEYYSEEAIAERAAHHAARTSAGRVAAFAAPT